MTICLTYKQRKSLSHLLAILVCLASFFIAEAQISTYPVDTSYNLAREYQKVSKSFPYISPAEDDLPEGVIAKRDLIMVDFMNKTFGQAYE